MVRARGVARKSFARRRVRRVKKYDHHVIPLRFKLQLPDMADRLEPKLDVHVLCETPTMELLETLGVPLAEYPYYLGFMKRMVVIYQTFTADTLVKERDSLIAEYVLRGKSEDVLEQIEEVAALCAEAEFEMDLWTRDFYKIIQFQDINGFSCASLASGAYNIVNGVVELSTGIVLPSWAEITDFIYTPSETGPTFLTWDKERRMRVGVQFVDNTNQEIYINLGSDKWTIDNAIGFKVVDNQIFGFVRNALGETLTVALATFNANDEFVLEARFKPNTECRFYINGVEVAVLTTGLPSGLVAGGVLLCANIQNTAAEDKSIYFDWWEFYQKR
jgi:hypothetical protein